MEHEDSVISCILLIHSESTAEGFKFQGNEMDLYDVCNNSKDYT